MMTLFTHVIPNLYDFLSSVEHNQEILNNAELRLSLYEKKGFTGLKQHEVCKLGDN